MNMIDSRHVKPCSLADMCAGDIVIFPTVRASIVVADVSSREKEVKRGREKK